jgi:hypothetical protein
MTFTKAIWPLFPRPYWPQCPCSEACELADGRRLVCATCASPAERALPARLLTGKDACAAIDRAERLIGQLATLEFTPALDSNGALVFCDLTGTRRDFARFLPAAYCFDTIAAALEVDPEFVGPAPVIAVKPDRKRELRVYRGPARAPAPVSAPESTPVAAARFWHVCPACGLAGPVDAPGALYCRIASHALAATP